jgi:hypothetical protein
MIKRIDYPEALAAAGGVEIASVVRQADGKGLSCVNVERTNPTIWGILLCDLLRQVAISFELDGLTLDGRTMPLHEINGAILLALCQEFSNPTSQIEQKGPGIH